MIGNERKEGGIQKGQRKLVREGQGRKKRKRDTEGEEGGCVRRERKKQSVRRENERE